MALGMFCCSDQLEYSKLSDLLVQHDRVSFFLADGFEALTMAFLDTVSYHQQHQIHQYENKRKDDEIKAVAKCGHAT